MMTTMRYEWITLPLGVIGLIGAYGTYLTHRRQCTAAGCRFVGLLVTQVILGLATLVVGAALLLRIVPASMAWLLQQL